MPKRIKDLTTTATTAAADDYVALDGATNGTRKILAGSMAFSYVFKTANYAAANKEGVLADTSGGAFTVTLPASPSVGHTVIVADAGNAWGTNNLTVGRNGSTISGLAENLVCNISGASVQLVYDGTTWEVYTQIGGNGGNAVTLTGTQTLTNKTISGASNTITNLPLTSLSSAGASGNLLTSDGTNWTSAAPPSSAVQFPQVSKSADYTLVLSDAGKQIFHPASDSALRSFTIPANSSVAFPVGTVVLFTVENGGRPVEVKITSDTLVFGNGTTGTIPVAANNTLMAVKVSSTKWMANYLYQTGSPATLTYSVAVSTDSTPYVTAYPFSQSGFGAKFTNPASLPSNTGYDVAFSPSGNAIAIANYLSPYITAYPWSTSGFGTKFTNPATLPTGYGVRVAFSPTSDAVAVAHVNSPFVTAYPWSASGFGTKFSDPSTLPLGGGKGVAFNPAGNVIVVGHDSSPYISAYAWSASGFGTKFSNPATLLTQGGSVRFSPAGDAIAIAQFSSPYIAAYAWSSSGFGTKFANPSTLAPDNGYDVAFSPAADAVALAHRTSPYVTVYSWSAAGFGTKFSNPATTPTGNGFGVAFNPAGNAVAVAHATSPYITAYPWSASGFGTKFSDPATLPTSQGNGVAFTLNP